MEDHVTGGSEAAVPEASNFHSLVADGRGRWYSARYAELQRELLEKYSAELEQAGWWKRSLILYRIDRDVRRKLARSEPSPNTFW